MSLEPGQEKQPFPFHPAHTYRPKRSESVSLLWPTILLFGAAFVALICWSAYTTLPQSAGAQEKYLRFGPASPKFKGASLHAPEVELPEILPEPEPDVVVVANATDEPPLLPPPLPEVPAPPVVLPSLPLEAPPPQPAPSVPVAVEPPKFELPPTPLAPPLPPLVPPRVEIGEPPLEVPAPEPEPIVPVHARITEPTDTIPLIYLDSQPGDTPMLRNWKTLAFCSLMTTTVFIQVPAPVEAGEKDKTLLERIDSLNKSITKSFEGVSADMQDVKTDLKEIRKDITALQGDSLSQRLKQGELTTKIEQIEKALSKIRVDFESFKTREPVAGNGSVDEIKIKLGAIEQAILKLQPPTNRIAMSPPSQTGRVMLVNLYNEELLFVLNQRNYRVAPGASQPVDNVPAGALNYEVISGTWGLRARNATTLAPSETFTLTAR